MNLIFLPTFMGIEVFRSVRTPTDREIIEAMGANGLQLPEGRDFYHKTSFIKRMFG